MKISYANIYNFFLHFFLNYLQFGFPIKVNKYLFGNLLIKMRYIFCHTIITRTIHLANIKNSKKNVKNHLNRYDVDPNRDCIAQRSTDQGSIDQCGRCNTIALLVPLCLPKCVFGKLNSLKKLNTLSGKCRLVTVLGSLFAVFVHLKPLRSSYW